MKPSISDIEWACCMRFHLTIEQMRGPRRMRNIARPRQIAMFLARQLAGASLPRIGRHFNRDHTTALHASRRIAELMAAKPSVSAHVEALRAEIIAAGGTRHTIAASIAQYGLANPAHAARG